MNTHPVGLLFSRLDGVVDALAESNLNLVLAHLREGNATPATLENLAVGLAQPQQRDAVCRLADSWKKRAPELSGLEIAAAIATLSNATGRQHPPEVAWSGPATSKFAYRSTQEVLREMIDACEQRLLIVSYSVSGVIPLRVELENALLRKVRVRFVLEHYDTYNQIDRSADFQKLGAAVLHGSRIFIWPVEKRSIDGSQARGSLHTKCVVRDQRDVFFTSANWTPSAMVHNMEMGVTLHDRELSQRVSEHFDALIQAGILREWKA